MANIEKAYISDEKRKNFESALTIINSGYYRAKNSNQLQLNAKTVTFEILTSDLNGVQTTYEVFGHTLYDLSNRENKLAFSGFREVGEILAEEHNDHPDAGFVLICSVTTPSDFPIFQNYLWHKYIIDQTHNNITPQSADRYKPINILEFVDNPDDKTYLLIVNKNYKNPLKCSAAKNTWRVLYEVANQTRVSYNGQGKSAYDYLNTGEGNKIYTNTNHPLTKLLTVENGIIIPAIKMEFISQQAYIRRQNKN